MLPPLKKWPRKQPYQQVRPDKEAVHCHTFEKMAAQTALSAGGVCRSASPPCLPFARHPPARERCLPLRIPPVPAVCAASPRQGEVSAAPHPSRACRLRGIPSPGRGICRSASPRACRLRGIPSPERGVCRSASPRACRLRGIPSPERGVCRSASPRACRLRGIPSPERGVWCGNMRGAHVPTPYTSPASAAGASTRERQKSGASLA